MRKGKLLWKNILRNTLLLVLMFCGTGAKAQYNREYFFWLGRSSMMNNDYKEAIRTLNILLRFDEKAFEGYFLRGIAKYNLDDLLGAEADFSLAIKLNPVYTQAYTYRAITRSRLGNYDDALKDFREAIQLRPDLPGPYYSRGVTRLLNQQFKEAIEDFDMFIRQEDKVADAFICRGLSYLQLKDTVSAYENFDAAIRTNREDPNGYNRRGSLRLEQERFQEAENDFNKAIDCDSTYLISYFNRALVFASTNRPAKALEDFDRVIRLDSTNALTYFNRAILRAQIGDYNRALDDYDKVARYSPNNVLVYYNRAGVYAQLGQIQKAVDDYSEAIRLYPDFANAYMFRGRLKMILQDPAGARRDEQIAQQKIEEYKTRLSDSTYSIYADTTVRFDRLLSFDSKLAGNGFDKLIGQNAAGREEIRLKPLYKFTLMEPDSTNVGSRCGVQRIDDFVDKIGNNRIVLACHESNISPDSLMARDHALAETIRSGEASWTQLFERAVTQSLIKQYTNAVNTFTAAIGKNPSNPFLYLNRSTTRAEMIDFISSIDNSYQRITIDADPAKRLNNNAKRSYNYDEAIEDLNKAIRLFPAFAHAFYNRANLKALSGQLPEAFEDYSKAVELDPMLAEAYFNRGVIQILMKDTRKGCLDLSKAGELGLSEAYDLLKRYTGNND